MKPKGPGKFLFNDISTAGPMQVDLFEMEPNVPGASANQFVAMGRLYCLRLVQLCERNFNFVDLGPPGTGKSYAVQELSPYAALLTGPTTVANMFGHMNGRRKGMVELWDSVVSVSGGTGKLKMAGGAAGAAKESFVRAFS